MPLFYQSTWLSITRYQRLGGLNNICLFPPSFGGWKFKIKVPAVFVSNEDSPPGLQSAAFSLCLHMVRPQHVGVSSGLSSYKSTIPVGLEVGSRPHLTFITTSHEVISKQVYFPFISHAASHLPGNWRQPINYSCYFMLRTQILETTFQAKALGPGMAKHKMGDYLKHHFT